MLRPATSFSRSLGKAFKIEVDFPAGLYLTVGFNNTDKFQPLTGMLPDPWVGEYLAAIASAKLLAPVMSFPETLTRFCPEINQHLSVVHPFFCNAICKWLS